jgi:hypothetical protein
MDQKIVYLFVFVIGMSCSKEKSEPETARLMIAGKTWYLDYTLQDNQIRSFVGRSTYFIEFKEDGKTNDADGITGTYLVTFKNNHLTLFVTGTTQKGVATNYDYKIDKIRHESLTLSYTQNNNLIQKIFTTTH